MHSITCKRSKQVIIIVIYKVLLELSYIFYLSPNYEYMGFYYNLDFLKLAESYILTLIILAYLPLNETRPSTIALHTLNIIMVIPLLSLYALKDEYILYTHVFVGSFIITLFFTKLLPEIYISKKIRLNSMLILIFLITGAIVYGGLISFNGLPSMRLLDFNNVYEVRANVNYGFNFIKYMVNWQATIINVFLIILSFINRKKLLFVFLVFLQIIIYLITAHKAYLFYPIIIPFIMYFIKKKNYILGATYGTIFSMTVSLVLFFSNINIFAASLLINRTLFLPAQISYQYYEYFSQNGLVLLSHSVFSPFFSTPVYDVNPILIIGSHYYTNDWANTGYLGDAYMNFGFIGMVIYSVLFAFILKLYDSLAVTEFKRLLISSFMVILMFLFTNGALLTNLLFGGGLLLILIFIFYNEKSIAVHKYS